MVGVSINSVNITESFGGRRLKDVARLLSEKHINSELMITSVFYNQEEIANATLFTDERIIGENDQIQFFTHNRLEIVFNLLDKTTNYLDQLIEKTTKVSRFYADSEVEKADQALLELMSTLDLFIELMTNIHRTVRIELSTKMSSGRSFHELEIHLLSVLKAVLKAREKQDTIMLYDLIEYELLDNLKQWKIMAIPELRNLKQM